MRVPGYTGEPLGPREVEHVDGAPADPPILGPCRPPRSPGGGGVRHRTALHGLAGGRIQRGVAFCVF